MASSEWRVGFSLAIRYSPLAIRYSRFSRLAVRIFPGLRDLHPGVGRHQPAVVEQRHEPEAHIDRFRCANRARAVNARIEAALAALLHDLLIDFHDLRLFAVELRHQAIGEAEIGGADIDAVDALDIEDRSHVID